MIRLAFPLSACAFVLAMVSGCGGDNFANPVPVSGKIMFNGNPVEDARVTFHWTGEGDGRSASGKTNAQGEFSLTTFSTGDGAIPGEYTVTVAKTPPSAAGADMEIDAADGTYGADYAAAMDASARGDFKSIPGGETALPEQYASAAESGITRSVVEGQRNEFTIDLD